VRLNKVGIPVCARPCQGIDAVNGGLLHACAGSAIPLRAPSRVRRAPRAAASAEFSQDPGLLVGVPDSSSSPVLDPSSGSSPQPSPAQMRHRSRAQQVTHRRSQAQAAAAHRNQVLAQMCHRSRAQAVAARPCQALSRTHHRFCVLSHTHHHRQTLPVTHHHLQTLTAAPRRTGLCRSAHSLTGQCPQAQVLLHCQTLTSPRPSTWPAGQVPAKRSGAATDLLEQPLSWQRHARVECLLHTQVT
jgi:hypothetical protein